MNQGLKSGIFRDSYCKSATPLKSIIIGLSPEENGLHLRAIANLSATQTPLALTQNQNKFASRYPSTTLGLLSGQDIAQNWTTLVQEGDNSPELKEMVNETRKAFRLINLDVDQDVFGWMDGEFAFGMVQSQQSSFPEVGLGAILMIETSKKDVAHATLERLEQLLMIQGLKVEKKTDATTWKAPTQELFLSYGWPDQTTLAMTVLIPF